MGKLRKSLLTISVLLFIMAVCAFFAVRPDTATFADTQSCAGDHSDATALTLNELTEREYSLTAGAYYLDGDIYSTQTITVKGTVELCLNGHTIDAQGGDFTVITVSDGATLTLNDCSAEGTGKITGANRTVNGGGVYVNSRGALIMNGGTISGNTAKSGGGVYLNSSSTTFTMNGGTISENTASSYGGGVYFDRSTYSGGGTFTMNDGTISGNEAQRGGGAYVYKFTMEGGTISGNKANAISSTSSAYSYGGGVYANSQFIMNGGTISENQANSTVDYTGYAISYSNGGGVFLDGSPFTMNGGTISGNQANATGGTSNRTRGGGVCGYRFIMNGGTISGNAANGAAGGGGVFVSNENYISSTNYTSLVFTMSGGTISENTAVRYGGGVYIDCDNAATAAVTMSDDSIISGNTVGDYGNGGGIYVSTQNYSKTTFTMSGNSTICNNEADGDLASGGGVYFHSYNTDAKSGTNKTEFTMSDNSAIIGNTSVSTGGGVYYDEGSWTTPNKCSTFSFTMEGRSTVSENTANSGGGVYIRGSVPASGTKYDGTFTMKGYSTVSDNTVFSPDGYATGGGVEILGGTFNMQENSAISGNTANTAATDKNARGGGVYASGVKTFSMSSKSTISGNSAVNGNGGGVYITYDYSNSNYYYSTFAMYNSSTISGNEAQTGGGVYLSKDSTFTLSGGIIKDNTAYGLNKNNVYLCENTKIAISTSSALVKGTSIGITYYDSDAEYVFTSGYGTKNSSVDPTEYFFADSGEITSSGTGSSTQAKIVPCVHDWDESQSKAATCTETGYGKVCTKCGLKGDVTPASGNHTDVVRHEASAIPEYCTDKGNIEYWQCTACGKYFSDAACTTEIKKEDTVITGEHDWKLVEATATCTDNGKYIYECSRCHTTKEETADALGHNMTHVVINEADCIHPGKDYWHCERCGNYFKDEEGNFEITDIENYSSTDALGHKYGEPVWEWSSDYSSATAIFTCVNAGCNEDWDGHTLRVTVDTFGEPSKTEKGKILFTAKAAATKGGTEYTGEILVDFDEIYNYNIDFKDRTVTYTGNAYSLYITGILPDGVTYSYEGNGQVEPGEYDVTVHFYCNDPANADIYAEIFKDRTAKLTIEQAEYDMSGISFPSATVAYTGNRHLLSIRGILPVDVTYEYENNSRTVAGSQTVTVKFTGNNKNYKFVKDSSRYEYVSDTEAKMTATLTVTPASLGLSGISLEGKTVTYDGNSHSLSVNGFIPDGVTVKYYVIVDDKEVEFTGAMDAGTYDVTARFEVPDSANYKAIHPLTASLTIVAPDKVEEEKPPVVTDAPVTEIAIPSVNEQDYNKFANNVPGNEVQGEKEGIADWLIPVCIIAAEVLVIAVIGGYIAFGSFNRKNLKRTKPEEKNDDKN